MVKTAYMLDKPKSSDAIKKFVTQQLFPAAIDATASVEGAVETVKVRVRRKPMPLLGAAFAIGALVSVIIGSLTPRDD